MTSAPCSGRWKVSSWAQVRLEQLAACKCNSVDQRLLDVHRRTAVSPLAQLGRHWACGLPSILCSCSCKCRLCLPGRCTYLS